jgi:branched-chain amino acid transport system permease protein
VTVRLRIALLAVAAVALPLIVSSHAILSVGVFAGISALICVGLCFLLGYSGQLSIGQTAFSGIGAYTVAIATTSGHVDPWLALALAIVAGAACAFVAGLVFSGLERQVVGLATLGLGIAAYVIFNESSITGGASGITGIPRLRLAGWSFSSDAVAFSATWCAVALVLFFATNLLEARFGRTLTAIGDSEEAARACGIAVNVERAKAFAVSGALAGLAGGLYAFYTAFVNPSPFSLAANIALISIVMIGGVTSLWGSIVGALFITILPEVLGAAFGASNVSGIQILIYGLCILGVALYLPAGIVPSIQNALAKRRSDGTRETARGPVADQQSQQII